MADWTTLLAWLFWFSVLVSVAGAVILPLLLIQMPADYFARPPSLDRSLNATRLVILILRNAAALILFISGIVMLFTPGQGLLMLLAALWLGNFPGKHRLERKIVNLPGVANTINKLRVKLGKEPLELPSS